MEEIITNASSCFLDAFALIIYLKHCLRNRDGRIPSFLFYLTVLGVELLLTANDYFFVTVNSITSMIITSAVSILTTGLLCLFYTHRPGQILFCAISFQVLVLLSEQICTLITIHTPVDMSSLDKHQYQLTMNLLSDVILLIMVIAFSLLFMRNFCKYPPELNFLLFVTPVLSVFILIFAPRDHQTISLHSRFYEFLCLSIGMLNVINEWLLERIAESYADRLKLARLTQQIQYQQEKYLQLSESYKSSRRIIHDIKKHYSVIQEYARSGQYSNLLDYLRISADKLEQTYTKYNTGNLVIDSLLTNYDSLAQSSHISFHAQLRVDFNKIPLSDYDLCVVLGNLMDNSLHASMQIHERKECGIIVYIATTPSEQFLIRTQNSWDPSASANNNDSALHGYGLENVRNIVESHDGIIRIDTEELFTVSIMIPIIE